MINKKGLFFLPILLFILSISFTVNAFAESYIEGGNEIIKKICGDITALKKDYGELKSFDNTSLNKSRRDELYIAYGGPAKSAGKKEAVYVYISYSKLPMSFKVWECTPNVFYSLKHDLFVGYCLDAKSKLREELLKIIEKDVR